MTNNTDRSIGKVQIKNERFIITDPDILATFNRPKLRQHKKDNGELVLYFFDNLLKSVVFIDTEKKQTFRSVKILSEGPNGISAPNDALVISDSEILVAEANRINIIDLQGNVLRRSQTSLLEAFSNTFFSIRGNNTHFEQGSDNVYLVNPPRSENSIDFMSKDPLISILDLESLKLTMTDAMLPEKYIFEDAYFDLSNLPYLTPYKDKLYLTFRVDKNLFEYDIENQTFKEIILDSPNADPMAKPSPKSNYPNRQTRYTDLFNTQTFLYPVFTKNYIYRPHSRAKNPDINPMHEMYLSVYDLDFNLIKEMNLSDFGMLGSPFKLNESIAFLDMSMSTEGELIIHSFSAVDENQ